MAQPVPLVVDAELEVPVDRALRDRIEDRLHRQGDQAEV